MPILTDLRINVELDDLLMMLGAKPERARTYEQMRKLSQQSLAELPGLIHPLAVYDVFDVSRAEPERLVLSNGEAFVSHIVTTHLARASHLAAAVVTVGPGVEERSAGAFRAGNALEGLVLDSAGSLALNRVGLAAVRHLQQEAAERGLQASFCIGPGSADAVLEDQGVVARLLRIADIGVSVTESLLLRPLKSLSLLVGYGPDVPGADWHVQCDFCHRRPSCPSYLLRQREPV
jgi:hypothetical protein